LLAIQEQVDVLGTAHALHSGFDGSSKMLIGRSYPELFEIFDKIYKDKKVAIRFLHPFFQSGSHLFPRRDVQIA
jgi:hypothetical protein